MSYPNKELLSVEWPRWNLPKFTRSSVYRIFWWIFSFSWSNSNIWKLAEISKKKSWNKRTCKWGFEPLDKKKKKNEKLLKLFMFRRWKMLNIWWFYIEKCSIEKWQWKNLYGEWSERRCKKFDSGKWKTHLWTCKVNDKKTISCIQGRGENFHFSSFYPVFRSIQCIWMTFVDSCLFFYWNNTHNFTRILCLRSQFSLFIFFHHHHDETV